MKKLYIVLTLLLATVLVSCGSSKNTIVVAASPKPHAEILEFAKPLLKEKGYTLEIKKFSDYVLPNEALTKKQVDANFFQHTPYLDSYNKEYKTDIISLGEIHIEPIGIYSKKYTNIKDVEEKATVFMSNSKTDHGRLIALLKNNGLLEIPSELDVLTLTIDDLNNNPEWNIKNLDIKATIAPEMLVDAYKLEQADLVLINSNFILDAKLNPGKDSIVLEEASNNPYANVLATIPEYKDTDKIKALVEVLTSKEVREFILEKWDGDIVPA